MFLVEALERLSAPKLEGWSDDVISAPKVPNLRLHESAVSKPKRSKTYLLKTVNLKLDADLMELMIKT